MTKHCAVIKCHNVLSKGCEFSFHTFPRNATRRKHWIYLLKKGEGWTPKRSNCVCSRHFKKDQFDLTGRTVRLREDAIPTILEASMFEKVPSARSIRYALKNVPTSSILHKKLTKAKFSETKNKTKFNKTVGNCAETAHLNNKVIPDSACSKQTESTTSTGNDKGKVNEALPLGSDNSKKRVNPNIYMRRVDRPEKSEQDVKIEFHNYAASGNCDLLLDKLRKSEEIAEKCRQHLKKSRRREKILTEKISALEQELRKRDFLAKNIYDML